MPGPGEAATASGRGYRPDYAQLAAGGVPAAGGYGRQAAAGLGPSGRGVTPPMGQQRYPTPPQPRAAGRAGTSGKYVYIDDDEEDYEPEERSKRRKVREDRSALC